MQAFDLGSVVVADIGRLKIHTPDGKPTTWVLDISGPGHPATLALNNDLARERLIEQRDQDQARVNGRKWKAEAADPEEEKQRGAKRWSRRIVGWSAVTMNGEPFAFTAENAAALLLEPRFSWVAPQYWEFIGADAAFIEGSAKV